MHPAHKPTEVEERLAGYLKLGLQNEHLAHFFAEALGQDGAQWALDKIEQVSTTEVSEKGMEFAKLIGARELDPDETRALEVTTLINYFRRRKALLANSMTAQEAAKLLSVTKQTIHDRVKDGKMVGLIENNVLRLPTFQFDPAGPNGIIAGLPEIMTTLNSSILGKISWMTSSCLVLDGMTPIDALKKGKLEEVLIEARSVGVT